MDKLLQRYHNDVQFHALVQTLYLMLDANNPDGQHLITVEDLASAVVLVGIKANSDLARRGR